MSVNEVTTLLIRHFYVLRAVNQTGYQLFFPVAPLENNNNKKTTLGVLKIIQT